MLNFLNLLKPYLELSVTIQKGNSSHITLSQTPGAGVITSFEMTKCGQSRKNC